MKLILDLFISKVKEAMDYHFLKGILNITKGTLQSSYLMIQEKGYALKAGEMVTGRQLGNRSEWIYTSTFSAKKC